VNGDLTPDPSPGRAERSTAERGERHQRRAAIPLFTLPA